MPTITPSEHVTRKHLVVDPVVAATSLGVRYPFFHFYFDCFMQLTRPFRWVMEMKVWPKLLNMPRHPCP